MGFGVFLFLVLVASMILLGLYPNMLSIVKVSLLRAKRGGHILPNYPFDERKIVHHIVHRVKNHMQLINSIISLQIRSYQGEEATVFLQKCQKRIYTIMVVYQQDHDEFVNDTICVNQYICELTDYLKTIFKIKKDSLIHFDIDISVPCLSTDICTPIGVIVNELICNSLQHAKQEDGKFKIYLRIKEGENQKILIEYYDTGVLSNIPVVKKLGLELMHLMVEQLKGDIQVEINAYSNLSYQIQFPLIKSN